MKHADIINLEHFHDLKRPYMSMKARAAQFAPYKSLVGYEEMIDNKSEEILNKEERIIETNDIDFEYD